MLKAIPKKNFIQAWLPSFRQYPGSLARRISMSLDSIPTLAVSLFIIILVVADLRFPSAFPVAHFERYERSRGNRSR